MKRYYLTDETEKSLAPFFSKRMLDAVLAGAVIVGVLLTVFWSRQPLSDFVANGRVPNIFFIIFAAALVVNSYVNLCCGCGEMVRRGYHMMNYHTDQPTYELRIAFYRYGLIVFLLHAFVLLLPQLPLLSLAAFSSAVSLPAFIKAAAVLYTSALFCRMSGFLVYLIWGRSSTLAYFAARTLMVFYLFATIFFAPAVNPLRLLYRLNYTPNSGGYPFVIYLAVVIIAITILILISNSLVRRHINREEVATVSG